MMASEKSTLERAFELAREGRCHSVEDIRKTLSREKYDNVQAHLAGPAIAKQIRALIDGARTSDIATEPQRPSAGIPGRN